VAKSPGDKQGWFEVIAGKSVAAFRREDEGEVSSAKCFGFVQTYDEKPRRRLWELMKSQGMQENPGGVHARRGRECTPRAGVPASVQRASEEFWQSTVPKPSLLIP
jgi:hypothetical protein